MTSFPEILNAFEQALELERELGTRTVECDRALLAPVSRSLGEAASRRFEVTDTRYVQKLFFNGVEYDKNYLKLDDLRAGGTLAFEMSSTPNTTRGTSPNATPSSWGL